MILEFEKYNKENKKKPSKQELFEQERQEIVEELESVDIEAALLGAIMATTGQNTVLGIDHTLQKERCMEEARKYNESLNSFSNLISRAQPTEN